MKSAIPFTFHKINKLLENPATTVKELAKVISMDASLSARMIEILKYCELPATVWDLKSGIRLLGVDGIRLVLAEEYVSPVLRFN